MINQFVNLFGRLPDKKKFWRDAIIFTLSVPKTGSNTDNHDNTDDNKQSDQKHERLFKVHLHLDMSRLTIKVYIVDVQNKGKGTSDIISYLYYCIMNAYWSYLTQLEAIGHEEFLSLDMLNIPDTKPTATDTEDDNKLKQYQFIQDLFAIDQAYIPHDMYISRNGKHFIHCQAIQELTANELLIASYQHPNTVDATTNTTEQHQDKCQDKQSTRLVSSHA